MGWSMSIIELTFPSQSFAWRLTLDVLSKKRQITEVSAPRSDFRQWQAVHNQNKQRFIKARLLKRGVGRMDGRMNLRTM